MITHFAGLRLNTMSIQGVKQFYHHQMGFPIQSSSKYTITFQPTPDLTLAFEEVQEPISPAHFAFEVPYSQFGALVDQLQARGITLLTWPDGEAVKTFETGVNVYFRDGDGNILELIAHHDVQEEAISPSGDWQILYMREIGMPAEDVPALTRWMRETLQMGVRDESDWFNFVIGGTAHAVVVSTQRRWIPIQMIALPPRMTVSFGVSDLNQLAARIEPGRTDEMILLNTEDEFKIRKGLYTFRFVRTTLAPDITDRLNLPHF
ncbi:VOC family protein [Paenibacillus guangzhouensis]|uniref:VOC family protein n=1 Tax=Paenibacillus guangzhouensis TaxID=1473112 RepID=UPI0012676CB4|nr:VOC family protein [Paenibacillus guangzhouensis]